MKLNSQKLSFTLLIIAAALFSFIPFYLFFPNIAFSSHTVAKVLIIFSLLIYVVFNFKLMKKIISQNQIFFILLLLYLLSQSFSIINAPDTALFLKTYHNTIIYVTISAITFFLLKSNFDYFKRLVPFCLFLGVSQIIFELILNISWENISPIFTSLIQKEVAQAYLFNASQGKLSLAQGFERFIPFLLIPLLTKGNSRLKLILSLIMLIAFALSFLSNFRIRPILMFFCLAGLLPFIKIDIKKSGKYKFMKNLSFATIAFVVVGFLAIQLSSAIYSFNVIDRFLLQNERGDLGPLDTRLDQINNSIEIFKAYPLFGIGLGNYPYFFDKNYLPSPYHEAYETSFARLSSSRPHNVFFQLLGETGFIGTAAFVTLIFYFALRDFKLIRDKLEIAKFAFIISSWSVMLYALFNPADSIFTLGWFWFTRGVIEAFN